MRVLTLACLLGLSALSACVAVDSRQLRAIDEDTCRSYGFRPGTDAFAACLQKIDLSRDEDRRAFLYGSGWRGPGYRTGPFNRW